MEFQTASTNAKVKKNVRIMNLEEYLNFFHTHNLRPLTLYRLNQIISMHGFKKMCNARKTVLMDAVSTLELIDPCRSTLESNDGVSSHAELLTEEEVMNDLAALKWQECCVTSLETLSLDKYKDDHLPLKHVVVKRARTSGGGASGTGESASCSSLLMIGAGFGGDTGSA